MLSGRRSSSGCGLRPLGLLVEIEGRWVMAAALPKSLLADMSEQQQIEVAVQLSKTAAAAEAKDVLRAAQCASRKDWRWKEVRLMHCARRGSCESEEMRATTRAQHGLSNDDEVSVDEAATAAAATRKKRRLAAVHLLDEQAVQPPAPGSPRARAAEAAMARERDFERLASQQRMRLPRSMYTRL